jgi:hypothetical protein
MTARTYARSNGLSQPQLAAIDLLVAGARDTHAARRLGLARETISRWRNHDPHFKTELQQRRHQVLSRATSALSTAMPLAVETFRHQIQSAPNRGRLALDLITRVGLMGKPYSGDIFREVDDEPTPEELEAEYALYVQIPEEDDTDPSPADPDHARSR